MRLISLLISTMLASCAMSPPQLPKIDVATPQAKLRVAVDSGYLTNIELNRTTELKCSSSLVHPLGWFHPSASGDWQRNRRYYGLRQGLPLPATVPENMYAEHVVAVDQLFYLAFHATHADCRGVIQLPLETGRTYEFLLDVAKGVCLPHLYEIAVDPNGNLRRSEKKLPSPITGLLC